MNEGRLGAKTKSSRAVSLLTALAVLSALWILLTTINMARLSWAPVPLIDDWDRWITYLTDSRLDWFWRVHVDHRLVLPKVFFELDHFLFQGRGWFLLVCSFCIQGLTAILLWRFSARVSRQEANERVMLAAVITALLFSAQQWVNFVWPFQIQFPLVYCAATAALLSLYKAAQKDRPGEDFWMAAALAAGVVANFSMANGVLLWPVVILAAFWLRLNRRWIGVLAAGAIVCGAAYFYHWHKSTPDHVYPQPERMLRVVAFWFAHLGSPLSPVSMWLLDNKTAMLTSAAIPGALLALAVLAAFVMLWRRRDFFNSAQAILVFYCAYLVLSSATMAYARADEDLMEAFTSRYHTPAYILWVCALLAAWPWLQRLSRVVVYAVLCTGVLVGIVIHQRTTLIGVRGWMPHIMLGEAAIVDNVVDKKSWEYIYHTPHIATDARDYLRNNHLSLFTEEWTHWPGIALDRRFFIDRNPDACQGRFEEAVMVPAAETPSWQLSGWAWDVKAGRAPRYVILGDDNGQVAGVALTGFPQPPEFAALDPKYLGSPWNGFVTGEPRSITAYVVEADDRSLCAIGKHTLPRRGREVDVTELGEPLPDTAPQITGGWLADGYYKGPGGPDAPPTSGPVFGSYPDAKTGTLRLGPFPLDGHTDIAIPLVTGPDNHNLSIVIRDAATKEVLATMTPPPMRVAWWYWRPDLPEGKEMAIEVIAQDNGSGWGQWLAIGWPHAMKK
jgi:hypothetical protein